MSNETKWWMSGNVRDAWSQQDVSEATIEAIVEEAAESLRWSLAVTLDDIKSPIERKLLLALIACRSGANHLIVPPQRTVRIWAPGAEKPTISSFGSNESDTYNVIQIDCQHAVGRYTADFIVRWSLNGPGGPAVGCVAVEADGHDFHEKTKNQAAHDKKRDRFFAAQGLTLLRFTGSEIHRAPEKCAEEVFAVLWPKASEAAHILEERALAAWRAGK